MPYILTDAFDIFEHARAIEILTYGAYNRLTSTEVTTSLIQKGLSYRRENMLSDYRRAQVISMSKDIYAEARAESFFENSYEPFRKAHGYTAGQMGEIMSAFNREMEMPPELEEKVLEWDEWIEEVGT